MMSTLPHNLIAKLSIEDFASLQHLSEFEIRRILMTIRCRDTDQIPKVAQAGETVFENGQSLQIMHNGLRIIKDCYYGPWMTIIIKLLGGHHEPQEELIFSKVLAYLENNPSKWSRPRIVELGSFWSYYSMWFQRSLPSAESYCLEPDPTYLEVGKKNFEINRLKGNFMNAKIGANDAFDSKFLCESTSLEVSIPTLSISSVLDIFGIDEVDVLLADIQGAEIILLNDLSNALRKHQIRFMIISTHDMQITAEPNTHQECLRILKKQGAHILVEHSVSESFSGDGLILASFFGEDEDLSIEISFNRSKDSLFGEWEPRFFSLLSAKDAEIDSLRQELNSLKQVKTVLEGVTRSKSWRVTKPLRFLSNRISCWFR